MGVRLFGAALWDWWEEEGPTEAAPSADLCKGEHSQSPGGVEAEAPERCEGSPEGEELWTAAGP